MTLRPGPIPIPKDYRTMVKAAVDAGWTLHPRRKGLLMRAPDGVTTAIIHGTCSDFRSIRNTRAELRRAGVAC